MIAPSLCVCVCACVCVCVCVCVYIYICVCTAETKTASYHAVHCKVVVLGLQLNSMLVVPSNLCVAGEEKPLVVHDPVEHLHTEEGKKTQLLLQNELQMNWVFPSHVYSQQQQ